ncbi:MAG TPA: serine hydrolase [Thermoanaerobaculia bacterium]|nr:serine hydrolase [Thermoanaerobaculia bacterium]
MSIRRCSLAAILAVLALPGLAAAQASVASDPRVASAVELARVWLEAERAYERIPGISAEIVHDQDVLWSGAYGLADVASGKAATPDTIYSICSISKLFTSVAVMQQRDAGKLRLDDPVGRHLPWFRLKKTEGEGDVTVEGLLTHASGLPRESDYPYWSAPAFAFPTHEQIVQKISSQAELYQPETAFQYSNLGLTLAGEIVAATSGMPYADYVRANILGPLKLSSTTPEMPEAERGRRLATGYSALDREGRRQPEPFFEANGIAPAAGYASTAEDLGRFASWQFRLLDKGGSEVLKATTLREMQRVHWAEPDFETIWGLGFAIWRDGSKIFVGHDGSCPGYRTALLLMPEDRIATVFLANAQNLDTEKWAQRLYDIVAPAVRNAVKEPGKGKTPDPALRKFAGTYNVQPWGGEIAVFPWEDGLATLALPTMEPVKNLVKLKKTGENTFRRIRKDEKLGEEIVFDVGPDGKATRFTRHSNVYPRIP